MNVEQEHFKQIVKDSNRRITRLKILSNFFQQTDLVSILIRTKLIHQTFSDSKELDINKLELFHLQYTDSLIELLQQLKKSKEQQILLLSHEISLNEEYIERFVRETDDDAFERERKFYSATVSAHLAQLYQQLATDSSASFDWSVLSVFTYQYRNEYYRELEASVLRQLHPKPQQKVYQRPYVTIDRKLLGKLNIRQFKVRFICGFKAPEQTYELFSIFMEEDMFMYCLEEQRLFLVDDKQLEGLDISTNTRQGNDLSAELNVRNMYLQQKMKVLKTSLTEDQEKLLEEYLQTISAVDFMEHLQSVDAQTNILRTMLNLNIK